MSSREARVRVRMGPNGATTVWVRREPGDLTTAVLGNISADGWAPVVMPCEVVIDQMGVRFDPTTPDEEELASEAEINDVTVVFPIEHVMGEPPPISNGPTEMGTWPAPRPLEDIRPTTNELAFQHPAPPLEQPPVHAGSQQTPVVASGGSLARAWRETSPPRKILAVLLPFALTFSVWAIVVRARAPVHAKMAMTAATTSIASATIAPTTPTTSVTPPKPEPPAAPPPAVVSPTPTPTMATVAAPASSAKGPPKKTLERAAADAVAAGSYPEALQMYEELSRQSPDVAAFRQAVRILKSKTAANQSPR